MLQRHVNINNIMNEISDKKYVYNLKKMYKYQTYIFLINFTHINKNCIFCDIFNIRSFRHMILINVDYLL